MKIVTYMCKECGASIKREYADEKVEFSVQCECGGKAIRQFNNITTGKENENVSAAIQTMLYSKLPSDKEKRLI